MEQPDDMMKLDIFITRELADRMVELNLSIKEVSQICEEALQSLVDKRRRDNTIDPNAVNADMDDLVDRLKRGNRRV